MQLLLNRNYLLAVLAMLLALQLNVNCQTSNMNVPAYSIREPSYIIVAPRVIRPAEKVQISVSIKNKLWDHIMVKALIYTSEQEIASGVQELTSNQPNNIAFTMPNNIRHSQYYLRVEGKLPTGEMKFSQVKPIVFQQKAVSIIIQLDRPDYRHEQISK